MDLTLHAYCVEYSSDAGETWTTGSLHWTVESAADEGHERGQQCYWRIRQIALRDCGLVPFEQTCDALDAIREAHQTEEGLSA